MADVTMPQLGESVTEGTITKWFKQVGEQIAEDEVLFEVSTDKVDSEVPSPLGGYLVEIRAAEGDVVEVGDVIAVVGDAPPEGGGGEAADGAGAAAAEEAPDGGAGAGEAPSDAPTQASASTAEEATAAPAAGDEPRETASAPARAAGGSDDGRAGAGAAPAGAGVLTSPVVRRLLSDAGIDPSSVAGTGPGGRITRGDAEAAVARGGATSARAGSGGQASRPAAPAATGPVGGGGRRPIPKPAPRQAGSGDSTEPLNNIRRRTGEHMVASKATSPHAVSAVEVDYEAVDRVRRVEREAFEAEEGFSLTYLPFIARAVVDALREFPHINSSVGDGELVVHHEVNLSVAVDLDFQGLLAPVVHDAESMRLRALARSIHDLAGRARAQELSIDEISGGTFTISNSGSFGSYFVLPIINQPQVAILSTDGITRRPVVVTAADGSEAIAIHSVGILAMSWDHRAFDGAYSAAFLAQVKEILETRDWSAEL
jgi:2-oxoglutarate dehydrogenase E2 component (dihydrolipoamide succinyltransferase)